MNEKEFEILESYLIHELNTNDAIKAFNEYSGKLSTSLSKDDAVYVHNLIKEEIENHNFLFFLKIAEIK